MNTPRYDDNEENPPACGPVLRDFTMIKSTLKRSSLKRTAFPKDTEISLFGSGPNQNNLHVGTPFPFDASPGQVLPIGGSGNPGQDTPFWIPNTSKTRSPFENTNSLPVGSNSTTNTSAFGGSTPFGKGPNQKFPFGGNPTQNSPFAGITASPRGSFLGLWGATNPGGGTDEPCLSGLSQSLPSLSTPKFGGGYRTFPIPIDSEEIPLFKDEGSTAGSDFGSTPGTFLPFNKGPSQPPFIANPLTPANTPTNPFASTPNPGIFQEAPPTGLFSLRQPHPTAGSMQTDSRMAGSVLSDYKTAVAFKDLMGTVETPPDTDIYSRPYGAIKQWLEGPERDILDSLVMQLRMST